MPRNAWNNEKTPNWVNFLTNMSLGASPRRFSQFGLHNLLGGRWKWGGVHQVNEFSQICKIENHVSNFLVGQKRFWGFGTQKFFVRKGVMNHLGWVESAMHT